jgi:glycosyltransferase involved in cell wall biosynthesis
MNRSLRVALLAPVAWRTPPRHYGPWEAVVSLLSEGLVERGVDVTLFATLDSATRARLAAVVPRGYAEDSTLDPKVCECMHIAAVFERAREFDLIHNHFDFLPLTYSELVETPVLTTIHGFSSPTILPVYQHYSGRVSYVSISNADRHASLKYAATIHHGIDLEQFTFRAHPDEYLLFFGRIHPHKGASEAIEIARRSSRRLILAGIIQDEVYFRDQVEPHVDGDRVTYVGSVGPQERDALLGGAFALLHPISFAEPFGLSVIEAMACGTPVIAFSLGSMPELIRDGREGFLVHDTAEAVAALKRIPELDRAECRRRVEEHFTSDRMVDDYLRVYEAIARGPACHASPAAGVNRFSPTNAEAE